MQKGEIAVIQNGQHFRTFIQLGPSSREMLQSENSFVFQYICEVLDLKTKVYVIQMLNKIELC